MQAISKNSLLLPLANDSDEKHQFDALFNECFKPLCTFCIYKFRLDLDSAKDTVHTAFIRLLETGKRFESALAAKAFLHKTVTNICLDRLRHEAVNKQHLRIIHNNLSGEEGREENNTAEVKQLTEAINMAIRELPDQMQEIFRLSRFEGLKYTEIASKTGLSVKTIETQISRALVKLRQKLSPYMNIFCYLLLLHILPKIFFYCL